MLSVYLPNIKLHVSNFWTTASINDRSKIRSLVRIKRADQPIRLSYVDKNANTVKRKLYSETFKSVIIDKKM